MRLFNFYDNPLKLIALNQDQPTTTHPRLTPHSRVCDIKYLLKGHEKKTLTRGTYSIDCGSKEMRGKKDRAKCGFNHIC